jgi:hypothetical protein
MRNIIHSLWIGYLLIICHRRMRLCHYIINIVFVTYGITSPRTNAHAGAWIDLCFYINSTSSPYSEKYLTKIFNNPKRLCWQRRRNIITNRGI